MSNVLKSSVCFNASPQIVSAHCVDDSADHRPSRHAENNQQHQGPNGPDDSQASPATQDANPTTSPELLALLSNVGEQVHELQELRRQSLDELQQLSVELAVIVASELVFRTLDREQFNVAGLVSAAVDQLGLESPVSVSLNPADIQLLQSEKYENPPVWQTGPLTLRPDAAMPQGHCRAETGTAALLSELGPRLEEIRESLLEGLDDAQIERRRTAGHGSALKRFPDRRETA